jgi:hypothetical protein
MAYDDQRGVRLGTYADQDPEVEAAVWCLADRCGWTQRYPIPALIERFDARGMNGREVGIRELAGLMRTPCPRCGGRNLESRPHFPLRAMGFSREVTPTQKDPASS